MLNADLLDTRRPKPLFGRWLLAQGSCGGLIAELALSAARDPAFPRDGDVDQVSCRLNSVGADGDMHDALDEAALAWRSI